MTDNLLGLCLDCLTDDNRPNQSAEVLISGTGYCQMHAREAVVRQQELLRTVAPSPVAITRP